MNQSLAITPIQNLDFTPLLPEIILSVTGLLVMLIDAFTRRRAQRWLTGAVSLAGVAASGVAALALWDSARAATETAGFGGMIVLDPMRLSFTLVFLVVAALTILVSMIWVEWEGL